MPWFDPPFTACFIGFLVSAGYFLYWGDHIQHCAPSVFREVKVFGFVSRAILVAELPRSNAEFYALLNGGYSPDDESVRDVIAQGRERIRRELIRSQREDGRLVLTYVFMLLMAVEMAADSFANRVPVILGLAALAVAAGIADELENRAIRRALEDPDSDPNHAARIRHRAIVKWILLAGVGLTLSAILLFAPHSASGAAARLMATVAGLLLLPFGGISAWLLIQWWRHTSAPRW